MTLPIPFTGATLDLTPPAVGPSAVGFALGVLAVPLAVALTVYLCRRELRLVPRRVALALLALRASAVVVVLLTLLFDPTVTRVKREDVPGRVVVAFDRSDSMRVTDPHRPAEEKERLAKALSLGSAAQVDELTRLDIAARAAGPLLEGLKERHAVEAVAFDQQLVVSREAQPSAATPGAPPAYTDLKLPLAHAVGPEGVLGVVVFTDGRHNWGASPLPEAELLARRKVPVYPVLVAPAAPPPDVSVVAARPQTATVFKGSVVPVEVEVRVTGWPAGPVAVKMGTVTETIPHAGPDAVYRLALKTKLDEPGPQALTVTAEGTGQPDRFPGNNSRVARVNVVKDRARVVLIDGEARWEFHYLHTCLGRDENMDVRSVVFRQPRVTRATDDELKPLGFPAREMPADPDALTAVDCVVVGDVEPGQFPLAERERIERYVADAGGTLVVVAGKRAMPLGYPDGDPFRKLLPVKAPRVHDDPAGFRLALTPEADRTWYLSMGDTVGESREAWGRFPPHFWAVVGDPKDGAEVLATVSREAKPSGAVLVRQNYGFGRVLYVGIDSTWRWRYKAGDYFHHRFWGQVAQWAASDKLLPTVNAAGTIRFGTREPAFVAGKDVEVVVRATGATREPKASAMARVVRLPDAADGKEAPAGLAPLTVPDGRPRELVASLQGLNPGRYAVELDIPEWADQLRGPPGPDGRAAPLRARFEVLPPDGEELVELSGNRELLEQIAAVTGGKVYTPEAVGELLDALKARTATREEVVRRPARQSWWLLAALVLVLTAEWGLRKWSGLP